MPSFVETMQGRVRALDGAEHDVSFSVRADGARGRFALRGIVRAPPWTPEAEGEGTLVMAPWPASVSYQVRFGPGLTLEGRKDVSVLRPVHSMTFMPVSVKGPDGEVLAEGSMRFDLKDLPRFLASWWPLSDLQQRRLDADRRALVRRTLEQV